MGAGASQEFAQAIAPNTQKRHGKGKRKAAQKAQADMNRQLLEKYDRTVELLMQLICDRGRQAAQDISQQFSEMYSKLNEQPKDIEKLTEMSEFVATLPARSAELQVQIDSMMEHHELLEETQVTRNSGATLAQFWRNSGAMPRNYSDRRTSLRSSMSPARTSRLGGRRSTGRSASS